MINVQDIKKKIKSRLGELWWYTLVLFIAQQLSAVINAVIGLWLVPKYVPQQELGAVLPLTSVGAVLALPLAILVMPFLKFLSKYMAQGEDGKVKKLLRDVFVITLVVFLAVSCVAYFFMPFVFKRMRVENGLLAFLIITSGILGALAPVFSTALQALKKFKMMSLLGFVGTLVRFLTLVVTLPVRGLSGYFVGQITPLLFGMTAAVVTLRKHLGSNIKMTSYWTADWRPILLFTAWNALLYTVSQIMATTEVFVIRHRLSDVESAGYYMISRFAEIAFYISSACTVVLFPLISEQHEQGSNQEHRLLSQATSRSFLAGILFSIMITPLVYYFFVFKADWTIYLPFVPHLFALCLIYVIRGSTYSFVIYKMAKNEFDFVPYFVGVAGLETLMLYCLTGYAFFAPWMPIQWMDALVEFNPRRLSVVLVIIFLHTFAILGYVVVAIIRIQLRDRAFPAGANQQLSLK
jgi:O-antigen/teichoic acid export membrane protein